MSGLTQLSAEDWGGGLGGGVGGKETATEEKSRLRDKVNPVS